MTSTQASATKDLAPLLSAMLNKAAFHPEHEKFYSTSPREQAIILQRPRERFPPSRSMDDGAG